jgi:hypothetical protein
VPKNKTGRPPNFWWVLFGSFCFKMHLSGCKIDCICNRKGANLTGIGPGKMYLCRIVQLGLFCIQNSTGRPPILSNGCWALSVPKCTFMGASLIVIGLGKVHLRRLVQLGLKMYSKTTEDARQFLFGVFASPSATASQLHHPNLPKVSTRLTPILFLRFCGSVGDRIAASPPKCA